ncbi:Helix-turn-helix domain protein [Marinobacterium sp. xm-a-152]|nr:Helix-turn-helix domain protein [Marinobacterium sp. xm-a-152]
MAIQHINQRALAERWQVSETTLERWRSQGVGPVFLKLHGRIVYREQDLEAYEEQCLRQSTAQKTIARATQQSSNQASSFA